MQPIPPNQAKPSTSSSIRLRRAVIGAVSGAFVLAAALLPVPSENVSYASNFANDQQSAYQAQATQPGSDGLTKATSIGFDGSLLSRLRQAGILKPLLAPGQSQAQLQDQQDQPDQHDQSAQPPQQDQSSPAAQQAPSPQIAQQDQPSPPAQQEQQAPQIPTPQPAPQTQPAPTTQPDRTTPSSRGGVRAMPDLSTHDGFITAVADAAQQSRQDTGVPPSVTIAQAILESDWGQSGLSKIANNFFGIKATKAPGPAGVVSMNTWEVIGGQNVTIKDGFKAYHNLVESVLDHGHFLSDNPRYAAAFQVSNDANEFAKRIHAAGYATDPSYSTKLINLMVKFNLYQYDAIIPAP